MPRLPPAPAEAACVSLQSPSSLLTLKPMRIREPSLGLQAEGTRFTTRLCPFLTRGPLAVSPLQASTYSSIKRGCRYLLHRGVWCDNHMNGSFCETLCGIKSSIASHCHWLLPSLSPSLRLGRSPAEDYPPGKTQSHLFYPKPGGRGSLLPVAEGPWG